MHSRAEWQLDHGRALSAELHATGRCWSAGLAGGVRRSWTTERGKGGMTEETREHGGGGGNDSDGSTVKEIDGVGSDLEELQLQQGAMDGAGRVKGKTRVREDGPRGII